MKGNVFRGDLPTLATPTTTWMCQNSKIKHPSGHATDSNNEFTDLVSLPLRVRKTAKEKRKKNHLHINLFLYWVGVSFCILITFIVLH